MALTGRVIFSSYAFSGSSDSNSGAMGRAHSLPSAQVRISAAPLGSVGGPTNAITVNSIVTVLPTGLNQKGQTFYTADSVATLNTNGS